MKLVGNLKKQVEETNSKEEAKELIENAGMLLTDEELDNVTGGVDFGISGCEIPLCEFCNQPMYLGYCDNPKCSCNNPIEKPDYK